MDNTKLRFMLAEQAHLNEIRERQKEMVSNNKTFKYTESPDLFDLNITNLFDWDSGITIGCVTKNGDNYDAQVVGKKHLSAVFSKIELAKGYIGACVYGREVHKKYNSTKQLTLF